MPSRLQHAPGHNGEGTSKPCTPTRARFPPFETLITDALPADSFQHFHADRSHQPPNPCRIISTEKRQETISPTSVEMMFATNFSINTLPGIPSRMSHLL
jgi:hypothetical protein